MRKLNKKSATYILSEVNAFPQIRKYKEAI